jgi:hypothetical protein
MTWGEQIERRIGIEHLFDNLPDRQDEKFYQSLLLPSFLGVVMIGGGGAWGEVVDR